MQIVNDLKSYPQFGTKTKRFMMCLWMMVMTKTKSGIGVM